MLVHQRVNASCTIFWGANWISHTCPDMPWLMSWWKMMKAGPRTSRLFVSWGWHHHPPSIVVGWSNHQSLHQPVTYRGMQAAFSIIILDEDFMGIPFRKQEDFAKRWRTSMAHDYQYMDLAGRSNIFLLSRSRGVKKLGEVWPKGLFLWLVLRSRGSAASSCWMPLLEECLF